MTDRIIKNINEPELQLHLRFATDEEKEFVRFHINKGNVIINDLGEIIIKNVSVVSASNCGRLSGISD